MMLYKDLKAIYNTRKRKEHSFVERSEKMRRIMQIESR